MVGNTTKRYVYFRTETTLTLFVCNKTLRTKSAQRLNRFHAGATVLRDDVYN